MSFQPSDKRTGIVGCKVNVSPPLSACPFPIEEEETVLKLERPGEAYRVRDVAVDLRFGLVRRETDRGDIHLFGRGERWRNQSSRSNVPPVT
jgi:hypothetical protein